MPTLIPKVDTTRPNQWWFKHQIYDGPNGVATAVYVPNVGDAVLDWGSGTWKVVAVDHYNTNLSQLQRVNLFALGGGEEGDGNVTSPTSYASNFRIYVNTKVIPHTLTIDSRRYYNGSANAYIKVFIGTDISADTGMVISAMINSSNQITSENIPLQNLVIPNGTNIAQKSPQVGYCSYTPTDGEVATVVVYTAAGAIASVEKMVIVVTDAMRTINQSSAYISSIELLSPFMSATDNRVIECPINLVTQSLVLQGKVTYDDGLSATLPIDGTKFSLAGKDFMISSQIGQVIPLVLLYNLSSDELSVDVTPNLPNRVMSEKYYLRVLPIDTFYSVKLFVVLSWASSSYNLQFFMYNLDRLDLVDVTSQVAYAPGSPQFNGTYYSGIQNITVSYNMQQLGSSYANFNHVQNIAIKLEKPAGQTGHNTYYTIAYNDDSVYGQNVKAIFGNDDQNAGMRMLDISCGLTSYVQWIDQIYRKLDALRVEGAENVAPAPTHVIVKIGSNFSREVLISQVITTIRNVNAAIDQGQLIRLEFISREGGGDKQLAIASMVATAS